MWLGSVQDEYNVFLRGHRGLVPRTVSERVRQLTRFATYLDQDGVTRLGAIAPRHVRDFLIMRQASSASGSISGKGAAGSRARDRRRRGSARATRPRRPVHADRQPPRGVPRTREVEAVLGVVDRPNGRRSPRRWVTPHPVQHRRAGRKDRRPLHRRPAIGHPRAGVLRPAATGRVRPAPTGDGGPGGELAEGVAGAGAARAARLRPVPRRSLRHRSGGQVRRAEKRGAGAKTAKMEMAT